LADSDLLAASLLLNGIIQDDVQENLRVISIRGRNGSERQETHIVTAKDTNDLATAVKLNKQATVEVLQSG
jgi:hypothetical protein